MSSTMRKKSEFTIVERAIQTIDGFQKVYNTLQQQTILRGQSQSTLENYIRQIALISLEFNKLERCFNNCNALNDFGRNDWISFF